MWWNPMVPSGDMCQHDRKVNGAGIAFEVGWAAKFGEQVAKQGGLSEQRDSMPSLQSYTIIFNSNIADGYDQDLGCA